MKEVAQFWNRRKMTSHKYNIFLLFLLNFGTFIFTHDSRKHEYYSFKDLREAVNGDVLTFEDQQRLFKSLHLLNCTEKKSSPDYRQVRRNILRISPL